MDGNLAMQNQMETPPNTYVLEQTLDLYKWQKKSKGNDWLVNIGSVLQDLERIKIEADNNDKQLFIEQANNEMLIQELHYQRAEIDNLLFCLKSMADYYLHEKEMDDNDLKLMQERVIDLLANPNAI